MICWIYKYLMSGFGYLAICFIEFPLSLFKHLLENILYISYLTLELRVFACLLSVDRIL
jgi:hypothetical protein